MSPAAIITHLRLPSSFAALYTLRAESVILRLKYQNFKKISKRWHNRRAKVVGRGLLHAGCSCCCTKRSDVSTGRLNTLLCVHLPPIKLVVFQRPYSLRISDLVLRQVSHLDAFSGYPSQT